jgi:hypothetical protein
MAACLLSSHKTHFARDYSDRKFASISQEGDACQGNEATGVAAPRTLRRDWTQGSQITGRLIPVIFTKTLKQWEHAADVQLILDYSNPRKKGEPHRVATVVLQDGLVRSTQTGILDEQTPEKNLISPERSWSWPRRRPVTRERNTHARASRRSRQT